MSRLPPKTGMVYMVSFNRGEGPLGYYVRASNWQRALKRAADMYQKDHKGERPVTTEGFRIVIVPAPTDDVLLVQRFGEGSSLMLRRQERGD